MDSVIKEIEEYKHKFFRTNSFIHKYSLVSLITSLEFYTEKTDKEFQDLVNRDGNYQDKVKYYDDKLIKSLNSFILDNYDLIKNAIVPYKTCFYRFTPYIEEQIDPNTCLRIISEFLLSVDPHLYNMFCELYSTNHILFKSDFSGGLEFNDRDRDSIHILVGALSSVSDMATLIHELGHAYKDYLIPDYHRYFNLNDVLESEISSKTLELMFLLYLIKNNICSNDAIKNFDNYQNIINSTSNQILDTNNYNHNYLKELSYLLGGIIANNYMINGDKSFSDFIRYIYFNNIKVILKDLNKSNIKEFHY